MSHEKKLRSYQIEALKSIGDELIVNDSKKCLVKMFCGTGKSAIMRTFQASQDVNLIVYVFPSLSLISQFTHDYLKKEEKPILKISSDDNSTTEPFVIRNFLAQPSNKIICVTYQSFATLIENLDGLAIDVCIFDEAHHAVGQTYQQLIFKDCDHSNKQIFFTATPKNANGITMYEKDLISDCGKMVYDYTYYRGITEGYLNPFEIRLDFYSEHNNHSIYESICRSILASGNNRVLTFHSDVNTDRETSVNNFVNQLDLDTAFNKILNEEFLEKKEYYKKIKIVGLSSEIIATCSQCLEKIKKSVHRPTNKCCCRYNVLENFDKTKDDEILIISSCETIGEGIDTKTANMCVFVDPKSSYVSIMQNIGRIVRKNGDRPLSTILIPCWVDKEKYFNCNEDKDKCDEAIREDLGTQGNFNSILNVMSALRQEDEELYDICLHYPDTYSPQEIRVNLERQGFIIKDQIEEGSLLKNIEYLLDEEIDYENYEDSTDEETLIQIASDHGVNIEVHTNSLEMPIETYISSNENDIDEELEEEQKPKKTIRLYKTIYEETEEPIYSPIVEKCKMSEKKQSVKPVTAPDRSKRMNVKVHTNQDIKVLWNISSDFDGLKDVRSCVVDCEIVDKWYERLDELKRFMDENERRPNKHSKNNNEKSLGIWIRTQISNCKNVRGFVKNQEKCNLWEQFLKDYETYLITNNEMWYEKINKLKNFIDKNKKRPSYHSKNKNEKMNGSWLSRQTQIYKNKKEAMQDPEKYELWTKFRKDYEEYLKSDDEIWYDCFEQLKKFIHINKRRPLERSKNEKQLRKWLSHQLQNYKNKTQAMKDDTKYNSWTQFSNEHEEYFKSFDDIWYEKFEEAKQFINENKQRPNSRSKNNNEKLLGVWIGTQNVNYKTKSRAMKDSKKYNLWRQFLKDYEEYFTSYDEIWYEKFEKIKEFIDENKKRPSEKSKNKEEKQLGGWMSHQNKNYKTKTKSMNDPEKYKLWTQFSEDYEEYLKTNDNIWYDKFEELKIFIKNNKKKPSRNSENNEKQLGEWTSTQSNNYKSKKNSMKDQEKYKLWTKFRIDNKDILNLKEDIIDYSVNIEDEEEIEDKELCFTKQIIKEELDEEEELCFAKPIKEEPNDNEEEKIYPKSVKKSTTLQRQKVLVKNKGNNTQQQTTNTFRTECELTKYHRKYITMRSDNLAKHFKSNRLEFDEYHKLRDENLESFNQSDRPHERIIIELNKIKTRRKKIVVDMGCGLAKIAEHFKNDLRFQFINYDHISSSENIIECDIKMMPLEDDSIEICIMSMALWGSNCEEYMTEAHRVLETGGKLYIIDSTKRWSNTNEDGTIVEGTEGERLKNILCESGFQIINKNIDKWCMFVCEKL
jgi:superfamily II DNA or RNA helicase